MKVYYWSPHTSHVATIKAVYNSALSLLRYGKHHVTIVNANGEWDNYNLANINIVNLSKKIYFRTFPRIGYLNSRLAYFYIFIKCFFPLKNLIKKEKPDFLIIHLITLLPLILLIFFKFETKVILRISGLPRLNIFRKFIWKLASTKLYYISAPTQTTLEYIKSLNIFDEKKIIFLPDPVYQIRDVVIKKKEKIYNLLEKNKKIIISVGRLTKQKNYFFLIRAFYEIKKIDNSFKLLIIGEGEQKKYIQSLILKFNLVNDVFLMGFVENIFKYIEISDLAISVALWEDPGFFIIESGILNKPIISSDCPNSPKELLSKGLGGYLFENNSLESLLDNFKVYLKDNEYERKKKILVSKNKFKTFSIFNHFLILNKIIL
jgi:glycosyltransferase involved in cell wall biosynthesis